MSNWNPALGNVMMSTLTEPMSAVNAERSKIKIGFPCYNEKQPKLVTELLGSLESISTEFVWNQHQRFPDTIYQHQILQSKSKDTVAILVFIGNFRDADCKLFGAVK